jgi:hypothetical protein
MAGLQRHEHRLGAGNRFCHCRFGCDHLGQVTSRRKTTGTDRRQRAIRIDIRPAAEYQRRLAPATGCEVLSDVGRKAFVPYTADYFFYRQ